MCVTIFFYFWTKMTKIAYMYISPLIYMYIVATFLLDKPNFCYYWWKDISIYECKIRTTKWTAWFLVAQNKTQHKLASNESRITYNRALPIIWYYLHKYHTIKLWLLSSRLIFITLALLLRLEASAKQTRLNVFLPLVTK